MGIYFPNAKMPRTCFECWKDYRQYECKLWTHVRSIRLDRHKYCPLTQVYWPHGNLIDATATKESIAGNHPGVQIIRNWIDEQPIIIPEETTKDRPWEK